MSEVRPEAWAIGGLENHHEESWRKFKMCQIWSNTAAPGLCIPDLEQFGAWVPAKPAPSRHPCGALVHMYKCVFYNLRHFFLFRPRVFPRVLGSVARREPARIPHASLGPDRGPWHALWGFKVVSPLGEGFRARRAIQASANPRTG